VATFGLRNALFPIGDKLLEVVSPTQPGTTAGRLLDKRDGDGGYMVIVQVDDLEPARRRFESAGARVVFEAAADGITGLHLHPADVGGAILSVDAADDWDAWPWAGPDRHRHVRNDVVTDVLAVEIDATDPTAMAARWAEVLGRTAVGPAVALDEGEIRFLPAGPRGDGVSGFVLRAADAAHVREVDICGCRFRLVAD
jgi:hypothetical protein